jgi:predicted DNA-binding transcriptional regulator YafY
MYEIRMANNSQKIQQLRRVLLLYQLVKTKPQMSSKELQEELGIGKSTYNRDRKFMESMGIKFSYSKAKRLQIITQDAYLPIPDLSLDERLAIILALSQLGELQESFLVKHARAAASKLLANQDDSFCKACKALLDQEVLHGGSSQQERIVDDLLKATINRRRIRISYCKPGQPAEDYEVEPYQIFVVDGFLYLDGYCIERKEIRCFKVCRIQSVRDLGITFSNLREYNFARRRTNVFGIYASDLKPEHVKVWFAAEIAPFIREESRHASQKLTENSDGSLLFEVDVAEPEEVLWWALRWGGNFEIIEPQWLREEAKKIIQRMVQRYKSDLK